MAAYLGFLLQSIMLGTYPLRTFALSSALLALGIVVKPGGKASLQSTDIDHHKEKGSGPADLQSLTAGECTGSSMSMASYMLPNFATTWEAQVAACDRWISKAAGAPVPICMLAVANWDDG